MNRLGIRSGGLLALAAFTLAPPVRSETAVVLPEPPAELSGIPVSYLVDLSSRRVLHARQADLRFVPASMTKTMTAQVAFDLIAAGRLREDQVITVDPQIAKAWSGRGTSLYLRPAEAVPVEILLRGLTTVSANDAAMVLASTATGGLPDWLARMNATARRLGMRSSRFATPTGWPDNGATYVSARDLGLLAAAMVQRHPDLYARYFGQRALTWNGLAHANRDPVTGVIPGADGIKTGHTREAGYNFLGSAVRDGRRLVMVVAGARSETERARASRALLEWGFSHWRALPLFPAGAGIGSARVQGGAERSVRLTSLQPVSATVPRAGGQGLTLRLVYEGPLRAPVARGQRVAELVIADASGESRVPLVAAAAVPLAGPLDRLRNGLYGLLP